MTHICNQFLSDVLTRTSLLISPAIPELSWIMTEYLLWKWSRVYIFLCNAKIPTRMGKFKKNYNSNTKALAIKYRKKQEIIKDLKKRWKF